MVRSSRTALDQGGKTVETLEVNPYIKDPVKGEFVDSPQAMEEAKKNGLKVKGEPGAHWTVGGGYTPERVSVVIDAKTGKFITREEVK